MKSPFFKLLLAGHLLLIMGLMIPNDLNANNLEALREKILNKDVNIRTQGFEELQKLKPFPEEAISWLAQGLDDSDEYTRAHYVRWLQIFGPKSENAAPDLIELFSQKKENPLARIEIPLALGAIGTSSNLVLPELTRIVGDAQEETLIRFYAIRGLKEIGSEAQSANPALKKLAADESIKVLQVASWEALARINPQDPQWIPKLVEMAEGKHGRRFSLSANVYSTTYPSMYFGLHALFDLNHKKILLDLLKKLIQSGDPKKEADALSVIWKFDLASQKEFIPDYQRLIKRIPKNKYEKDLKGQALVSILRAEKDPEKRTSLLEKIQKEDPDPKFRDDVGKILENIKQYSKLRKK